MLEGLVAWVLNNYLGKYVENLNTDQLSVALLSGKVELENLPLKKDALRHLGLPVEIKAGFIGKVQLHVPVRQIRSAPWLIAIERLYLVAAPVNLDEWDSGLEALIAHDRKLSILDALEAEWRAEHEANDSGYYATSYSSWLSYGTGLLANIAENLQLTLNDVHIRYEDAVTCPGAFACGLTVESLAAESCDSDWLRAVTPLSADSGGCSFKLLQLQQLAVYWDRMPVPGEMFANCTVQELSERMSQTWRASHAYVVSPASATARVRRERTAHPLRSRQRPRLTAHLVLEAVQLQLSSRQYGEAVGCARGLERIGRLRELRARRPPVPVRGHARAWWLYALRAHCPRHRWMDPRPTWESCLERARATRLYLETYLSTLTNPAATLPPDKKTAKDDFEWNTPMHILKPLRELAMHKVPKATPAATPDKPSSGRSMLVQWFPQWWGWYGTPAEGDPQSPAEGEAAPLAAPAPPDLEEEILDVIADSLENDTLLKRDSVFGKFEFVLNKGSLNLCGDGADEGVGLELQFSAVSAGVEWRARAGAHALSVALGALTLRDRVTRDTLFPVLVAPQGVIREGLSAMNAAAACMARSRLPAPPEEPLFQLAYEKRPAGANCDRRLWVKSGSVEAVASAAAARWAHAWLSAPWGGSGDAAAVRDHTRATLNAHLHHMMHPEPGAERRSWQVELDIYAPQILFAEDPCERDASLLVVDFGRLRLSNAATPQEEAEEADVGSEDSEEAFMTPCSTPPGSLQSPASPPDAPAPRATQLDAASLHTHIYDRYKIELSDMQVLVGRARDNWKYAHTKSSSTLHLLDRFTISLQAERRVVHTLDPQYPTATLCGTLPALVVHLSEQKLASLRAVLAATEPFRFRESRPRPEPRAPDDSGDGFEASRDASLFMLQFAIDQMSLEVQSRGRSIAEVQVCGVKAALSARPGDLSLSLSVHSLLLVDALQTYGPDFELLVASHKHVGMDTASGSIRDSEPTSPTSPTSPASPNAHGPPPPHALHRALDALHSQNVNRLRETTSPERPSLTPNRTSADPASRGGGGWAVPGLVDSEALIALELCLIKGEGDSEDLRIANILFNNLDIIANQETIVELIGFAQRVMGAQSSSKRPPSERRPPQRVAERDAKAQGAVPQKEVRTEITFDFHRLGVLLLRAALHEGALVAKKIATATVSEAKIQATVASRSVRVDGSLGGVQVLSLCESAGVHSRVLSAGCATHDEKALHFGVTRHRSGDASVDVGVRVSVARVWYAHSGALLRDLRSCLTEFKQYLANLARSIRAAAADMAIGLVHPRGELASQWSEGRSQDEDAVVLSVAVSVESPVVVVPRAPGASQALVAHLGRLTLTHQPAPPTHARYRLRLADISLATLDVADAPITASMEQKYDVSRGKPVLHDTALQLTVSYCDDDYASHQYEVSGKVLGGLHVTASREQYEQLLETLHWLSDNNASADRPPAPSSAFASASVQAEAGVPTLQLDPQLRAAVLAVPPPVHSSHEPSDDRPLTLKVDFELEDFTVELRADLGAGERSLVKLTFREFSLLYHRLQRHETALQVSLHSVTMEDLTQEPDSKHRMLMVSHAPQMPPKAVFLSKSCPQLADFQSPRRSKGEFGSLPTGLHLLEAQKRRKKRDSKCGATPPCSPESGPDAFSAGSSFGAAEERAADNLVWISVHTRDPRHPDFADKFNKVSRLTKVDFNSLNLVVNVDSWVTVLDFFGFAGEDDAEDVRPEATGREESAGRAGEAGAEGGAERSQTEISVRSLSVVVVGGRGEACRALMSRLAVVGSAEPRAGTRALEGRVGALLLADLTPHAPLWRHRLRTLGDNALSFRYRRLSCAEAAAAGHDASLAVETGPLRYVHTKRFVQELQAFARDFGLLRRVIHQARRKVTTAADSSRPTRLHMRIRCASPVIVVPVSGRSRGALLAELTQLDVDNRFRRAGAADTVSSLADPSGLAETLDVRRVRLSGLTVWCARGLRRRGPALLSSPAHLEFNVEHNMEQTHNAPDMTIQGTLTTLECALDPEQYRLVRGVLAHNLGESLDDLLPSAPLHPEPDARHQVWKTSSLKLDLQDVKVKLEPEHGVSSLACINFIKSRLLVETYSDLTQDIDLVSQEILVSDTRFAGEPANRRGNVFTHIVQPMAEHRHSVQAEVHARKRCDSSAYTILVHNMRLMAVLDWWEAANQFIMQPPPHPADTDQRLARDVPTGETPPAAPPAVAPHLELKLNVTDSQLVLVEDASVWDTNAVILKSTTVVTYRAADAHRPVSCELNELEVFSCVLGLEEETALSIVEPAAVHVALHADRVLHVATGALALRLSYHDMRMFAAMLRSLPAQARAALSGAAAAEARAQAEAPANSVHMRAARPLPPHWLSRRLPRAPPAPPPPPPPRSSVWPLKSIRVNADSITLCVIDDCLDSDVPLLEVSLADLSVEQDLRRAEESFEDPVLVQTPVGAPTPLGSRSTAGGGRLAAVLSADYYNRTLSGWEPFVEPWRFETAWESTMTSGLTLGRLQVEVASSEVLNTNVTSSLIELWQLVRANWAADYYAPQASGPPRSPKGSPAGHRRRSPFVPYALRNDTGQRLWFTTLLSSSEEMCERRSWAGPDDSWVCVRAGDTEPFSFGRRRGREPRLPPQRLHQVALRLDGWAPPDPVCVDRVGVFFRQLTHTQSGCVARVVLEVSLEGSARKLVTVRSALRLLNLLPHAVDVRLDQTPPAVAGQSGVRGAQVPPGGAWAAPLCAQAGPLRVRPLPLHAPSAAAPAPVPAPAIVDWRVARDAHALLHCECRAPPNAIYRFCCAIVRERFPPERGPVLAGHTLRLVPSLRLENLLPLELQYRAAPAPADDAPAAPPPQAAGALPPSDTATFHEVNVEEGVELSVKLEGFGWSSALSVGGGGAAGGSFNARLKLRDLHGRRLYLNARVAAKKTDGIKVSISAPYWLVNRTGLPLVFRAEGAAQEAAGQFEEHEVARMVAPLLFSFAEADGGPTLSARLGSGAPGTPEWCSPFGLGPGVAVKRLEVRGAGCERSYAVGVAVRQGRGRYRHTHIATFAPRYQLHNNTSHHLQFAQKCTATTLSDPGAQATHVSAVSGCFLPWHWARWDRERLLCVRTLDAEGGCPPMPRTAWSGGFRVETARTLHAACREAGGGYQLVRVEVVVQGATLFVVLTDAECAPPPVRLHNYSPVSVMFHQTGCAEESVVGAHGSVCWAPPEPEGAAVVALRAPGGPRSTVQLDALGTTHLLAYQNFIYVVFTATLDREHELIGKQSTSSVASDEGALVLEVPLGSTKVLLGRKRYGDRSQLWRRGPNEQLIHEGSSPPQPTDAPPPEDGQLCCHTMVLDIEGPAPRPGRASALVLRRADPRRASTQAWRAAGARMACAHANLCVQAELTAGAQAFLALAQPSLAQTQAVSWRSLRPGSGRLQVTLTADGPTRLLRITDHAAPESGWIEGGEGDLEEEEEEAKRPARREWGLRVALSGLSVSLVARSPPAELVHALFAGLLLELGVGPRAVQLALSVRDMQWDNQLPDSPVPVLLQCLPEGGASLPALHAALELARTPARRYNARFFRHLIVAVRPLAVRLEERLMLKLWAWASPRDDDASREAPDENEFEARRVLDEATALHATRYYFALVKVIPSQIRLSMQTRSKLEPELLALQRRLALTLVKFEDAAVELQPFVRTHAFETAGFLGRQLLGHFKDELKWQAAKILGSVDFLGNPLGFVADVSEGVSGLLYEGSVAALLKNVTHGLSNSAAKVTGSLGDGLERVVPDEAHEETRRRIRSSAAGAHLAAGFRGLGLGILGGVTSLVKHSYEGAAAEGLPGLLAGVGKGLVGTVTKPVIGVLDLAAETASALRESSRRGRASCARVRGPRCAAGAGGLLPRYCEAQAAGAALLYELNGRDYAEAFLAYRVLRGPPHDIRALLSSTHLRIFSCKSGAPQLVMEAPLGALAACAPVVPDAAHERHLVELAVRGGAADAVRRPRVQCDDADGAAWLARTAAYARQLHYEREHTLLPHPDL